MKSHGCQFCEDGERRPASRIWSRSSAGIGRSAKDRTLRRDSMASRVCMMVPTPPTTWLLRLFSLFVLYGLLDGEPQPILVRYGQVAPDELQGLAFERVHAGLNL